MKEGDLMIGTGVGRQVWHKHFHTIHINAFYEFFRRSCFMKLRPKLLVSLLTVLLTVPQFSSWVGSSLNAYYTC